MKYSYLFVYGTLLSNANNDMSRFLLQYAKFVSKGYFYGKLYLIDWYPGAIVSINKDDKVFGHIYKILDETTLFETLDDFEGIDEQLYIRCLLDVYSKNKTPHNCWIYLYNQSVANLKQIFSGDFLNPEY
ncbi:gamma-glutamylcyclotransferase family protein [Aestuariivivens marinum]|uniref:gamma-glutamylcyclotransferase family protein n=1 Tax=Aestuariivivens marinum TaxID=2913555 RepID=UPI001F573DFD|nr:gamma-glutamylcyclotransferase family protein [Aestuariivivens marinum]